MKALRETLQLTELEMEDKYRISEEHIKRLQDDTWQEISRPDLLTLKSLEQVVSTKEKPFEVLRVRLHPLWETFKGTTPLIFRTRQKGGIEFPEDTTVMTELQDATGLSFADVEVGRSGELDVDALMKSGNTIFTGSPKHNLYLEKALCGTFGQGEPFNTDPRNRSFYPFQYYWDNWDEICKKRGHGSAFGNQASKQHPHGLKVRTLKKEWHFPLTPRYTGTHETGWDIGVLVARRFSDARGTKVTSIALAGHSGFATKMLGREITRGSLYVGDKLDNDSLFVRYLLCAWVRRPQNEFEEIGSARWYDISEFSELLARVESDPPKPSHSKRKAKLESLSGSAAKKGARKRKPAKRKK